MRTVTKLILAMMLILTVKLGAPALVFAQTIPQEPAQDVPQDPNPIGQGSPPPGDNSLRQSLAEQGSSINSGSVWVPEILRQGNPFNNPFAVWLQSIFGIVTRPTIAGQAGSDTGASHLASGLGELFLWFNGLIFVIGSLLMSYNVVVGVVNTAKDGQILGKEWSSTWAPTRVVIASALMIPLPSGFTAMQVITVTVAIWGVASANLLWSKAVNILVEDGLPLTTPAPPNLTSVERAVAESLLCLEMLRINMSLQDYTGQAELEGLVTHSFKQRVERPGWASKLAGLQSFAGSDDHFITVEYPALAFSAKGSKLLAIKNPDTEKTLCGYIGYNVNLNESQVQSLGGADARMIANVGSVLPWKDGNAAADRNGESMAQVLDRARNGLLKAQEEEIWNFAVALQKTGVLREVALNAFPPSAREALVGTAEIDPKFDEFNTVVATFRRNLIVRMSAMIADVRKQSKSTEALRQAMINAQFVGAGFYAMQISRYNGEFGNLMRSIQPIIQPPTWQELSKVYGNLPKTDGNNTIQAVRAAYESWYRAGTTTTANPSLAQNGGRVAGSGGSSSTDSQAQELVQKIMGGDRSYSLLMSEAFNPASSGQSEVGNVIANLSGIGHTVLYSTEGLLAGAIVAAAAIGIVTGNGWGKLAGTDTAFGSMISLVSPLFSMMIFGLLSFGTIIAYVIPMVPSFMWMFGVLGLLILVIEAVLAGPLWAFAHLRMGGSGLSGQAGDMGYLFTLDIFLRPMLMIFGMLCGLATFEIIGTWVGRSLYVAFGIAQGNNSIGMMGNLAFLAMTATTFITLAERCFALVTWLPDRIMIWLGSKGQDLGEEKQANQVRAGTNGVIGRTQSNPLNLGAGKNYAGRKKGGEGGEAGIKQGDGQGTGNSSKSESTGQHVDGDRSSQGSQPPVGQQGGGKNTGNHVA
jgi:conjugal transfer/type IV secretion protein DotA/TraY